MTRIDDQIREALSEDDRKLLDQFGDEPGMFELIGASFRSKMRAWVVLTYVMTFVFLGLGVWFFVEIINAETSLAAVQWGTGFLWSVLAISMLKLWNWMQMNQQAMLRELKRIELQIAVSNRGDS